MKKPNSQAETHSNQAGPPRDFHRYTQKHTAELLDHHLLHQLIFFLFIFRLQAQARTGPGSLPRGSRKDLFFLFIYRLQAQARPQREAGTRCIFFFTSYII